ncbi:MAG: hypothetical protein HY579_03280 [Nitrospinae bacterium]|nr:hypothetical protein [Nitrospinota bacterium]
MSPIAKIFSLIPLFVILILPLSAHSQESEIRAIRDQLDRALERQEKLDRENARLNEEVKRLRVRLDEMGEKKSSGKPGASAGSTAGAQKSNPNPPDRSNGQLRAGFYPGGKGFYIKDEDHLLRLLGYVQAVGSVFDSSLDRQDGNGDFSVRRARFDFLGTVYKDYTLFFEFDAGPGTVRTADSDFAMVEGGVRWAVLPDSLQLAAGKFITFFSAENFRGSRALDMIERYMALNNMFLLPGLDSQFGAMIYGKLGADKKLGYFLGAFNGNGLANANLSDDNDAKEIQVRLNYDIHEQFTVGVGFDHSYEQGQTLSLADLGFNRYVSANIAGERFGFDANLSWKSGRWRFEAEGLAFNFNMAADRSLGYYGGYVQPSWFVLGDGKSGLEALLRGETSYMDTNTRGEGDTLWAVTPGLTWYVNPNVRLQADFTEHYFNGPSSLRNFSGSRWVPMFLTELQFKY